MKHFGKTIQAGIALAALDLCRQIWFVYTGQHSVISLVFSLIAFAVLLRGVSGLRRGDPEGGVLGAGASAFFAPLGLVCLLACLLSRDRLLREACAAGASVPPVPEGERTATEAAEASTATDGGEAERQTDLASPSGGSEGADACDDAGAYWFRRGYGSGKSGRWRLTT